MAPQLLMSESKERIRFRNVRAEAWALIRAQRRPLMLGLLLMIVGRVAALVLPASSKLVIDDIIGEARPELLTPLAVAVGAAILVQAATSYGLAQIVSVAGQRAIRDARAELQAHVLRLPVAYFDRTKTGSLISRVMNDPEGIRNLVGTGVVQLVGSLTTAILALGVLLWLNWKLTVGVFLLLIGFAHVIRWSMGMLRPIFRERWQMQSEASGRLAEALAGVRLLKLYVAEEREGAIFRAGVDRLFGMSASVIRGTSGVTAASTIITGAISLLILLVGGRAILAGTMTVGDLVMYAFFVGLMTSPLMQIASIGAQMSEAFAALDRIREIRSVPTEEDEDESRIPVGELTGAVTFEGVDFEYEPGVPVLRDVRFHTPAGSTTALVGPSGAGKSTLVSLLMAFGGPKRGRILVGGQDLASLRRPDYRRQIGVVMQENILFDGTLRENIALAKPGASEEEIVGAARIAHCDEFVERLTDKYETVVGERGVRLSGGQRQRIAIARAILADPQLLILDEATSSLDSESEALIRDGLRALRRGRTTFVIAHRLSTIRSANQILVLDKGLIVERGTHADLLEEKGGLYRRLYERQRWMNEDAYVNSGDELLAGDPGPGRDALSERRRSAGSVPVP